MSKPHSSLSISLSSKIDVSNASVTKPGILKENITFMPPTNSINSYSSVAILIPQDIPVHLLFCTSLDFAPISKNCLRCTPGTALAVST